MALLCKGAAWVEPDFSAGENIQTDIGAMSLLGVVLISTQTANSGG